MARSANSGSHVDELELRQSLVDGYRRMNASGLNQGTSGNLSVRHGAGFLVTPSGVPLDRLSAEDMVYMDGDGRWSHPLAPSSEWRFHRDILGRRPEAGAVVHAHPPYCTTLAILGREIPAIHYMIAAAGGPTIRCARYETFGTGALSAAALEALEGRLACLLANHGMIAMGPTLERALWLAEEVETLARQYVQLLPLGSPRLLSDEEVEQVRLRFERYGPGRVGPDQD